MPPGMGEAESRARLALGGEQAFVLDAMDAVVEGRAALKVWGELVDGAHLRAGAMEERHSPAYACWFAALPIEPDAPFLYLTGNLERAAEDRPPEEAVLRLHWELMPDKPPPARIQRSSDGVGGLSVVLRRLAELWPDREPLFNVNATFVLDADTCQVRPVLDLRKTSEQVDGHHLRQTALAWEINPPSGAVSNFSLSPIDEERLVVVASGELGAAIGPDLGERLQRAMWSGVEAILFISS
jgi:hypothetical protein